MPPKTAEALHATLEDLLEAGGKHEDLERAYRILSWRILATQGGGPGLAGIVADVARRANSVEEYEAARDEALGPILGGLENPENRDP